MSRYTAQQYRTYCEIRGHIVGCRIFFAFLLGVVFIALKLFGQIGWSWWWVTAPYWGAVAYGLIATLAIAIFGVAGDAS